jgi:hypothetical protein
MVVYTLSLVVWMCWISGMKLLNVGKKLLMAVKKRLRMSYLVFALSELAGAMFATYSNARKTRYIYV